MRRPHNGIFIVVGEAETVGLDSSVSRLHKVSYDVGTCGTGNFNTAVLINNVISIIVSLI